MDEFLAELYGTRETVGATSDVSDMDKLAEAQVLDSIFESEGINVDEVPDESILKLAYEIFGDDSALVKEAMEGEEKKEKKEGEEEPTEEEPPKKEEGAEKEAESFEEKFAQADQLGRVMAHAFVNEQAGIDKEALSVSGAGKAIKGALGKSKEWLTAPGKTLKGLRTPTKFHPGSKGLQRGRLESLAETAKRHKGQTAAVAGLGVAGAGAAAAKAKKKESSALDMLAEQRAIEMLKEAGIEQEPATEEKLAATIDQRALEMLVEAGYSVE